MVGVVAVLVLTDDPYVAQPPDRPAARADATGAARTLAALERAVRGGDVAAAATLAPAGDDEAAELLASTVRNARALRVADFSLRYLDAVTEPDADGAWTADVALTWRLAGFDEAVAATEVRVGLSGAEDGEVALRTLAAGPRTPLWLSGPVTVRRTAQTLVVAAAGEAEARRIERLARRAVPVVQRVLPGWRARLVVEVPASADGLDRVLGTEPGTYAEIAAVATTVDGSTDPRAPVHVVVNPTELGTLGPVGAQVVVSHEVAHVATGAATSRAPVWLVEGFADYVALRDVDLPASRTAAQAIATVRRDGLPTALPDAEDFGLGAGHLGAVYESAWLLCTVLAERGGEPALVALVERLADGDDLEPALRDLVGWSSEDLLAAWRERLRELAG